MLVKVIFSLLILFVHYNYACDCITFNNCNDNNIINIINQHCLLCEENNQLINQLEIKPDENHIEYFFGVSTKTYLTNIRVNCKTNGYIVNYIFKIYSERSNKFLRQYNLSDRYYLYNNHYLLLL